MSRDTLSPRVLREKVSAQMREWGETFIKASELVLTDNVEDENEALRISEDTRETIFASVLAGMVMEGRAIMREIPVGSDAPYGSNSLN